MPMVPQGHQATPGLTSVNKSSIPMHQPRRVILLKERFFRLTVENGKIRPTSERSYTNKI